MIRALAAVAGALLAWALLIEPRRLVVREVELAPPGWPRELDGLRVALVADLHTGAPHVSLDRVVRAVQRAAPDLVALLGDYVDDEVAGARPVDPAGVAAQLARMRAPLGSVAVLGNHDWIRVGHRMGDALRGVGIDVLEETAARLANGLWVAGVGDKSSRSPSPTAALRAVPEGEPVILLSHDPDVFPMVPDRVAITFSGHTHGGQVDVPGLVRKAIPSRHGTRFKAGHVIEGGRHLFVSRGIGTSRWPVRFNAPPEVVIARLVHSSSGATRPD